MRTLSAVVTTSEPPPIATQLSVRGDADDVIDSDIAEDMETDLNRNVVMPVPEKIKSRSREAQFIEVRRAKKPKLTDDDVNQNETKAPGMDSEETETKVGLMFFPSTLTFDHRVTRFLGDGGQIFAEILGRETGARDARSPHEAAHQGGRVQPHGGGQGAPHDRHGQGRGGREAVQKVCRQVRDSRVAPGLKSN